MPDPNGPAMNMEMYRRKGGAGGVGCFCSQPHPDNPDPAEEPDSFDFNWCRRLPHYDGSDHSAFIHSISVPETWPDTRPGDDDPPPF